MIWSFARANQMVEHDFTDDVAITLAFTKKQAIKKFSKYYENVTEDEVVKCRIMRMLKYGGVAILTDY